ncbi:MULTISPECIES: hypothetical protein [Mycolicibacterium]|jgi:hypothetical protein|uniref:Uncharacterized protein n=1 Tax=Mycolicibacterium vanbaalenii (strain DSM 7251 / JCM 13017 / BCRC 16820 / KCTC 9966 / NRRL B-24157 / PYR-1) TaxID=350058 RepID=A1T4E0_MYCVP|nr:MULTISPECIES: hypothetical protein [Mycolicibacterium]ABM12040.1 hypothetical protein Mvan_1205 [Mycolicibacterium vanbaalenii PYR-1]MCV7130003.1 hypothetical protein [Mycolicibacterium vanbaalenii PYR-1]MDW5613770.1 hypothetical protein [Mycolicibacterium sp. D5.8-2]QZT57982.1 hypothetical protein JN084_05075 [Mycolicibacterium austroafricanum]QZY47311.1 hypothetical protein K5L12_06170 [Mycolicibacterium austroafricanum]
MKNFTIATAVAAGLTAAALGLAGPAVAAPSATGDAQSTISELQAGGNRVIVNKLGSAPLSEAEVVGVHTGGNVTEWVNEGGDDGLELRVVGKVYYVTVR